MFWCCGESRKNTSLKYIERPTKIIQIDSWSEVMRKFMGSMFSLFSEEVKIVFMRLVKCMKNIDNFCSPLNKLCSIIKMLPILDNMCCSTKHWLMFQTESSATHSRKQVDALSHYCHVLWVNDEVCKNVTMSTRTWKAISKGSRRFHNDGKGRY